MRNRFARWSVIFGSTLALLLASASSTVAQSAPPRLVQGSDGTLYMVASGTRYIVTPDPIPDSDLAALSDGGAIGSALAPPAAAAPAVPVPASNQPQAIDVEVTDYTSYQDSLGTPVVVGVVQNKGQVAAGSIDIAVSLLSGGTTVGAAQAFQKPRLLLPGEKGPWSAPVTGASQFDSISIQVQAKPPSQFNSATHDFRTDGVSVTQAAAPFNTPSITGRVTNTGQQTASLIEVSAAIYSPDGKILDVRSTVTSLNQLAPGQTSPFAIDFLGGRDTKTVSNYELFVEGEAQR